MSSSCQSQNDFLLSGIKNKILKSLTESVTELQYQYQGQYDPIPSNEVANRLCTALEAIFSHGLKVSSVLSLETVIFVHTLKVDGKFF